MEQSQIKTGQSYLVRFEKHCQKLTPVKIMGVGAYRVKVKAGWTVRKMWTGVDLETKLKVTIKNPGKIVEPIKGDLLEAE